MIHKQIVIGNATLLLGDCNEIMGQFDEGQFDLAVVDPPYFKGPNRSGFYGKSRSSLGVSRPKHEGGEHWGIPSRDYFQNLKRVSRHQIIWGANHFADRFESASPSWIVWDKQNAGSSFADAELAFCSMGGAVRMFRYVWNGMHQGQYGGDKSRNEPRIHPTQKPVALYEWLLTNYAKPGQKVLDTHMGSGSSAIAANAAGIRYIGIEIDPYFFEKASARIEAAHAQLTLFEKTSPPFLQEQVKIFQQRKIHA